MIIFFIFWGKYFKAAFEVIVYATEHEGHQHRIRIDIDHRCSAGAADDDGLLPAAERSNLTPRAQNLQLKIWKPLTTEPDK